MAQRTYVFKCRTSSCGEVVKQKVDIPLDEDTDLVHYTHYGSAQASQRHTMKLVAVYEGGKRIR